MKFDYTYCEKCHELKWRLFQCTGCKFIWCLDCVIDILKTKAFPELYSCDRIYKTLVIYSGDIQKDSEFVFISSK